MRAFRFIAIVTCVALAIGAVAWLADLSALLGWAAQVQREVQNAMAASLRAVRAGDPAALFALCALTFAYGFVHALGPGHGKILLGGTALANRATLRRLAVLTLASSLAQSLTAILLVLVGAGIVSATSRRLAALADDVLAPISYAAIGAIGLFLVLGGARATWLALAPSRPGAHAHETGGEACGCGQPHAPAPDAVRDRMSLREMAALVASIAVRPCTGAVFLLVIAWGLKILPAGILATLAMGLGTAALNIIVAATGLGAVRSLSALGRRARVSRLVGPVSRLSAGLVVALASAGMLAASL